MPQLARRLSTTIAGWGEPAPPRIGVAFRDPARLHLGGDVEEQLYDQRAMIALLRFEFVDLVAAAKPGLVGKAAGEPLVRDVSIPAAVEQRTGTCAGQAAPVSGEPVAILVGGGQAVSGEGAWIPGAGKAADRAALAARIPTLEQDDCAAAVRDLGELEVRQPIGQGAGLGAASRVASFKFR